MKKGKVLTEEELNELHLIGLEHVKKSDFQSLKLHALELSELAVFNNSTDYEASAKSMLGYCCYWDNSIQKAINLFEQSFKLYSARPKENTKAIIQISNSLGALYKLNGERGKAMKILKFSIDQANNQNINNSTAYNNVGTIYLSYDEYLKAIDFYELATKTELNDNSPDILKLFKFRTNKARALLKTNQIDEAEKVFKKTYFDLNRVNDGESRIAFYKGLSKMALYRKNYAKAEKYLLKTIEIVKKEDFKIHLVDVLLDLAQVQEVNALPIDQEKSLNEALDVAKNINKLYEEKTLTALTEFYRVINKYRKATQFLKKLIDCKAKVRLNEKGCKTLETQERVESLLFEKFLDLEHTYSTQLKAKNEDLKHAFQQQKKVELRLETLRKQLQPGYIFNTLQDIQGQAIEGDSLKASDYVADLASLMRGVLRSSRQERVTLKEELKLIRLYVQLEQRRRDEDFAFEIKSSSDIDHEAIHTPPFLLLAFVQRVFQIEGIEHMEKFILHLRHTKEVYVHIQLESQVDEVQERAPNGSTFGQFTHFSDELLSYKDIEDVGVRAKEFQHSHGNRHYVLQLST